MMLSLLYMLSGVYEYSGILMVVVVWLMVVIPSLKAKLNYKKQPISKTGTNPRYKNLFNTGLVLSGFLLLLFAVSIGMIHLSPLISLGSVFLVFGAFSLSILGVVTLDRSVKVHNTFSSLYYVLVSIGALFVSMGLYPLSNTWSVVGMFLIAAGAMGIIYFLYYKKLTAYAQYWSITFSSIWVVSFYLFLL